MFVPFLYELRDRGVRVGAQEALSLAQALALELHRGTLDGFYEVARALCVHREQDLDGFDRAFAHHFHGVPDEALAPYRALGITFVRKGNLSTKKETLEWRCQRHHCFEFSEECMPLRLSQVPEHLALCLLPVR